MITGKDVLTRALRLMNEANPENWFVNPQTNAFYARALCALNQTYSDLWFLEHADEPFTELSGPDQAILLSARCIHDIMPYGVAMFLAQFDGDGNNQFLFATLYNQKRASVHRTSCVRSDVLPIGGCL